MTSTSALKSKRNTTEELMEKKEIWVFMDIECRVDKKIYFKWNTLFQVFPTKYFQVLLQDDLELNKGIYKNISKSGLHQAEAKTLVLPCPHVIEWMTQRIDHGNRTIINF